MPPISDWMGVKSVMRSFLERLAGEDSTFYRVDVELLCVDACGRAACAAAHVDGVLHLQTAG